ncbi:MAG: rRNA maturation RNase YbeY [Myxococcales bacterium]|nr:rRNA maturation RNase YbeY [Myxococcales bacterium]
MPFHLSIVRGPHAGLDRADLKVRLEAMMRKRNLEVEEVSFLLTDDKQIHELNREYRGYDKPTDVLAFALTEGDVGPRDTGLLGDVIVSVPTARRQAREAKRPLVDELTMLLAHGLLHLLGYDHATVKEDRVMRAETDVLVAAAELASASKKKKARAPSKKRTVALAIAQRSPGAPPKKAPKKG